MDAIRRALATIRDQFGKLGVLHRLLIGSLAVIAVLTLVLVSQVSNDRRLVTLAGFSGDAQGGVIDTLQAAGIEAEAGPAGVMVAPSDRYQALAVMQQAGLMSADTRHGFQDLLSMQDWKLSREQNRQQYFIALQNELGAVLSRFTGIRSASVIIDVPEQRGLNAPRQRPSASVTLVSRGGQLSQDTVDAAASLVSGAVAGLSVETVEVLDAVAGRSRRATPPDGLNSGRYMEQRQAAESTLRSKLEEVLWYIPGVVVAVTADVDVTRVQASTTRHLPDGDGTVSLPARESTTSTSESDATRAAEAGVRANQGLDLNRANGSGRTYTQEQADTEFDSAIGVERRDVLDPRGATTYVTASVSVPEGFIAGLVRGQSDDPEAAPDPEAVRTRFEAERATIESLVRPHLTARGPDGAPVSGELRVAMIPVSLPTREAGGGGLLGGLLAPGGGGVAGIGGGGLIDAVLVGATALVAMGLMVMLIRRSGKRLELPSPEELVGIPPALSQDGDLIGEVGEGDTTMTGIEVSEDRVTRTGMLGQVSEMIEKDPSKAAKLLGRWIEMEE